MDPIGRILGLVKSPRWYRHTATVKWRQKRSPKMPSNCQVSHCPRANGDISETLVLSDQQRRPWKCLIYVNIKPDRGSKSSHLQSWSRPTFGIFCQTKNQLPRFVCPINYPRSRLIVLAPYVILPLSMCVVLVLTPSQGLFLHLP